MNSHYHLQIEELADLVVPVLRMGHYNFRRDLAESKIAVEISKQFLLSGDAFGGDVEELPLDRQNEGDLEVIPARSRKEDSYTVEVKYDILARKTKNLCFEISNKKGEPSGIAKTKAEVVHYIVPRDGGFTLYEFSKDDLLTYMYKPINHSKDKIRIVSGGDRKSYHMMLVKIDTILEDNLPLNVEEIDA